MSDIKIEMRRARCRHYYYSHREELLKKAKSRRNSDPGEFKKRRAAWYTANKSKFSDRWRSSARSRYEKTKTAVFSHYGKSCLLCGDNRPEVLSIDHIPQHKDRKHSGLYAYLAGNGFPDGFRTLCYNCNRKEWMIYNKSRHSKIKNNIETRRRVLVIKTTTIEAYGGKCSICGECDIDILSIDHINGGGTKHRKSISVSGGREFYKYLASNGFPGGYRVLCFSCNIAEYRRSRASV